MTDLSHSRRPCRHHANLDLPTRKLEIWCGCDRPHSTLTLLQAAAPAARRRQRPRTRCTPFDQAENDASTARADVAEAQADDADAQVQAAASGVVVMVSVRSDKTILRAPVDGTAGPHTWSSFPSGSYPSRRKPRHPFFRGLLDLLGGCTFTLRTGL
jgi:hypothetical protein